MEHIWLPPDQRKHNPWSGSSPERRKRGESSQYDDEKYYRNRVLEELNKGQRVPEACNRCKTRKLKCDQNGCCQNCEIAGVTCEQIDRTTRESIPRADRLRRALALEQLHITVCEQKNTIAAQNNQIENLQAELRAATRKLRQFDVSELHLQPSGFLSSFSAHPPVTPHYSSPVGYPLPTYTLPTISAENGIPGMLPYGAQYTGYPQYSVVSEVQSRYPDTNPEARQQPRPTLENQCYASTLSPLEEPPDQSSDAGLVTQQQKPQR